MMRTRLRGKRIRVIGIRPIAALNWLIIGYAAVDKLNNCNCRERAVWLFGTLDNKSSGLWMENAKSSRFSDGFHSVYTLY